MTKEEAITFLDVEIDDLNDLYDEKLHEIKQFFYSWVPISKTMESKRRSFKLFIEAFLVLGLEKENIKPEYNIPVMNSPQVDKVWQEYQGCKQYLKILYAQSVSFESIFHIAEKELELYRAYAKKWPEYNDESQISFSKEEDPMLIQEKAKGVLFEEILKLSEDELLVKEAKRLTLWKKFDENEL